MGGMTAAGVSRRKRAMEWWGLPVYPVGSGWTWGRRAVFLRRSMSWGALRFSPALRSLLEGRVKSQSVR